MQYKDYGGAYGKYAGIARDLGISRKTVLLLVNNKSGVNMDTTWAQILSGMCLSAWNVMMLCAYFTTNILFLLHEAAEIDGSSQFRIFRPVVLPLGKPILATIGIFLGLSY